MCQAGEAAQWVKVLVAEPEFAFGDSRDGKREQSPASCPLTSSQTLHLCTALHPHIVVLSLKSIRT